MIKESSEIVRYLGTTRGVGHSELNIGKLKDVDCLIVVASFDEAKYFSKKYDINIENFITPYEFWYKSKGCNKSLVFDNNAIHLILNSLVKSYQESQIEIHHLREKMNDVLEFVNEKLK